MTTRRYFLVRSRPDDKRVLERALYNHSRIAGAEENVPNGASAGKSVFIVETAADTDKEAAYLASYQVGRLGSFGSFGLSEVFETYVAAEFEAGETWDAYPEMVHFVSPAQHLAREFGTDVSEWEV